MGYTVRREGRISPPQFLRNVRGDEKGPLREMKAKRHFFNSFFELNIWPDLHDDKIPSVYSSQVICIITKMPRKPTPSYHVRLRMIVIRDQLSHLRRFSLWPFLHVDWLWPSFRA